MILIIVDEILPTSRTPNSYILPYPHHSPFRSLASLTKCLYIPIANNNDTNNNKSFTTKRLARITRMR